MQKFPNDWDLKTKIEFLQRKVILNSIAYYIFDTNFISDKEYDELSKQLASMHSEYGDISDTQYGYAFCEFDSGTGFDLYYLLNEYDKGYLTNMVRRQVGGGVGGTKNKTKR